MKTLLTLIFSLCFFSISINAQIYVDKDATGDNDGTSWADAYTDLQPAIDAAIIGDEIWVAEGTYYPTVEFDVDGFGGSNAREKTFYINKNIKIYGGFIGNELIQSERDWKTNATILNGDLGIQHDSTDNAYHVVFIDGTTYSGTITNATILDGFHIANGNADGSSSDSGGGIYNDGSGNGNESSPSIINCSFNNNSSLQDGGAIINFGGNSGESSPAIINCSFKNNSSKYGGAVYNFGLVGTSEPIITNCAFFNNNANVEGGAIFTLGIVNTSTHPKITNCTFYNNNSTNNGNSMYSRDPTGITIENCIFWHNNITTEEIAYSSGSTNTTINNSIIKGGCPTDVTCSNIWDIDPQIMDAINGDLRLQTTPLSPAINVGNNSATGLTDISTDLDGNSRIIGGTVDLGAYEANQYNGRLYVNGAQNPTTQNGYTWQTAFTDLQDAIDYAVEGDSIWVASGTYLPTVENPVNNDFTDRDFTFYISKEIQLYGGFNGTENNLSQRNYTTNITTLSGDLGTPNNNSDNAYHVVYVDGSTGVSGTGITNETIIDGFHINDGHANGANSTNYGGGIYNHADNLYTASPSILNCSFSNNKADEGGGAICNQGNTGSESSPLIINCIFYDNIAEREGGAVYNRNLSKPKITNCIFNKNRAIGVPLFGGSRFEGDGGAIYSDDYIEITNCTFYENDANLLGGAIKSITDALITNCIFWNNTDAGGIGNTKNISGTATVNYSIYEDLTEDGTVTYPGGVSGTNNSDYNPLFEDAPNANFQIEDLSPARNTGDNNAPNLMGISTDIVGNDRIINGTIDMGAYENLCAADVIFVNIAAASGGDGLSWGTAFTNLQDAINLANPTCGNEIWVAQGTYLPTQEFDGNTDRFKTFYISKDIKIYGGFTGSETMLSERDWKTNTTTLSGDIGTLNDNSDNAYHVVYINGTNSNNNITNDCILNGFTIKEGNAGDSSGAGIYNNGINSGNESSPSILNCTFFNNTTTAAGGAIYNRGRNGKTNPKIVACRFYNNNALNGGAIYSFGDGGETSPEIINSLFYNNTATDHGGAFGYDDADTGAPRLTNCTFVGNTALNGGLFGTRYWDSGGSIVPQLENCIGWNNSSTFGGSGNLNIDYSLIQESSCPSGVTCTNVLFDIDPLFIDVSSDDFHLENYSPAINVGNNNAIGLTGITTDYDDNSRITSPDPTLMFVDLGAYEVQTFTGTDTDMDGVVDGFDNCPNSANSGLHFDGTDDYVSIPQSTNLNFAGDFTVETWINASSWETNVYEGTIIGKDGNVGGVSSGYVLRCGNNGQLSFIIGAGVQGVNEWPEALSSVNAMSLNTWHHVVGVLNSGTLKIYIDGEEVGSKVITEGQYTNSSSDLLIGESPAFSGRHFNGKVDEVRLWNTVRTEQELRGNMLKELSGSETNLIAYYQLNEGVPNADNTALSNDIIDNSTNLNYGTLTNFNKTGTTSNWVDGSPVNFYDSDNDGSGDVCDICPGEDDSIDTDMDGVPDCIDCLIDLVFVTVGDCINDEYSFTLKVIGTNPGASYSLTGDITGGPYMYGQTYTIANMNQTVNFNITDMTGNCSFQATANAPTGCGAFYDCTENDLVFDDSSIESGTYSAINTITSESTIESPKVVIFQASMDIKLEPGFVAEAGSDFTAEIVACNTSSLVAQENNEIEKDLSKKEIATDDLEEESEETEEIVKEILTPSLSLYPNPTNRLANIAFTISESSNNTLAIYNNTGTMIKLLADNQWMEQGEYIEEFDVQRLPAGIYVVVLHTASQTMTKKLIVIE